MNVGGGSPYTPTGAGGRPAPSFENETPIPMKKLIVAAFALGALGLTACTDKEKSDADEAKDAAKEAIDEAGDGE